MEGLLCSPGDHFHQGLPSGEDHFPVPQDVGCAQVLPAQVARQQVLLHVLAGSKALHQAGIYYFLSRVIFILAGRMLGQKGTCSQQLQNVQKNGYASISHWKSVTSRDCGRMWTMADT